MPTDPVMKWLILLGLIVGYMGLVVLLVHKFVMYEKIRKFKKNLKDKDDD